MQQLDFRELETGRELWRVDAWGRVYEGCACPSQPVVQDVWVEAVRRQTRPGQPTELIGFGFSGGGEFFASICFCAACQYGYGAAGGILEQLAREGGEAGHPSVNLMLMWRRSVQYGLLQQMREAAEGGLWLRTAAELRYTGEKSSLTFEEARGLVEACTVVAESDSELHRLRKLPRPMPVYLVNGETYSPIE